MGETHPNHAKCQSFNVGTKRAKICTQKGWQHVNTFVNQVYSRPACRSFAIHGGIRVDEMGNICDVYEQPLDSSIRVV